MSTDRVPFRLLAITPPSGALDPALVEAWLDAGVDTVGLAVLLRTPGADFAEIGSDERFEALRARCAHAKIPVLVGLDPDAELPGGLGPSVQGVQLRRDPDPAAIEGARRALGAGRWLGRSVHGAPGRPGPAPDYTVFAPVFAPNTPHPGVEKKPKGLPGLKAWAKAVPEPVFALGGVDPDNAAACLEAGAAGLAGISPFFGRSVRVVETVRALVAALHDVKTPQA